MVVVAQDNLGQKSIAQIADSSQTPVDPESPVPGASGLFTCGRSDEFAPCPEISNQEKPTSRPVAGACNGFAQPLRQQFADESPATANGRSNGLVSNGNSTTAGGTAVGSPPGSLSPTSPPATTPPKTEAKLAVTSTGSPMDEMHMASPQPGFDSATFGLAAECRASATTPQRRGAK
ncbi:hypothetical protein HPB51_002984 [Rhipicephalus microplus]|uniref:Uncharacterized protein n=1 Tax=Rhipicephalus microplus TaxID=6941 RepID=A0A9J6EEL8_RHIMP|nr:hypothetical protein HPB51_002984 [Rhipicephalus microplus]